MDISQRNLLELAMSSLPTGLFICDRDGIIRFINDAYANYPVSYTHLPFSRKGLPPLPNLHIFTEHAPPPPGETGKCGRAVRCAIPGWNRCTGSRP